MTRIPPAHCTCEGIDFGSYERAVCMVAPFDLHDSFGDSKRSREVCIDICITRQIAELWQSGVKTMNSCCGHGKLPPSVIVEEEYEDQMRAMGYEQLPDAPSGRHVFKL